MSEEPEGTQEQISRRRALKRMAAAGAVAWAVPVVQTVNMRAAWAQNASPQRVCYRVKIESTGSCQEGIGANDCLKTGTFQTTGGCAAASPVLQKDAANPDCIWTVTVNSDCIIVNAEAKTGNTCVNPDVSGLGTNTVTINTCQINRNAISHVELEVCCEQQEAA